MFTSNTWNPSLTVRFVLPAWRNCADESLCSEDDEHLQLLEELEQRKFTVDAAAADDQIDIAVQMYRSSHSQRGRRANYSAEGYSIFSVAEMRTGEELPVEFFQRTNDIQLMFQFLLKN